jgi:hypothetical protein
VEEQEVHVVLHVVILSISVDEIALKMPGRCLGNELKTLEIGLGGRNRLDFGTVRPSSDSGLALPGPTNDAVPQPHRKKNVDGADQCDCNLDCESNETTRTTAELLDATVDASYSNGRRRILLDGSRQDS